MSGVQIQEDQEDRGWLEMDWFTADTHFGHTNIIKYCNRPFADVKEMDNALLRNINDRVQYNDRLFHLGDVAFKGAARYLPTIRSRINCANVFVVPGNHDRESQLKPHFSILPQGYMYENDGFRIVLCHYAMRVWHHSHHGAGMLYGHSHGGLPPVLGAPSFDVGVDCWEYHPISLDDVKKEMKRLTALTPIICAPKTIDE
jgi:calcineurin-like phosphoesterase family protein